VELAHLDVRVSAMTMLDVPISEWMHSPITTIHEGTPLPEIDRVLLANGISSVPVVDDHQAAVGVVSRTDLLRVGRVLARKFGSPVTLELPAEAARAVMHKNVVTVNPREPITYAARRMVNGGFHRVFACDGTTLVGVVGTREILAAIAQSRIGTPIGEVMTSPAITIEANTSIADATDKLERSHVSGLFVLDDLGWPIGVFSQVEALGARALPSTQAVSTVMSAKLVSLYDRTQLSHAAAQAFATGVRRIIVFDPMVTLPGRPRLKGVVTGVDFARAIL
jgi:CBS domain-containing protein